MKWETWFKGLVAAVIGGTASAIVAVFIDPVAFNLNDLPKLGKLAGGAAIINLCFYLKGSPLPPSEGDK